ncbi:MFS transporter [Nocardioides sambongensis]|uniref:MFS transporter n=1 Tax=Nocardioides sambongensis TaxID=2589074 RepID=UPI0011271A32|nr:MFS transporter [Nocardioides sambongensis]
MLSNVATGAATGSFLTLLLPPFVTNVTGEPWRVGVVFAVLSLAAAIGPVVGSLVDRTRTHRVAYTLSLVAMAGSYALLAVDAAVEWYSPLFGLLLGAAWAAQGTIGPALIVGAGDPADVAARRLTRFNLAYPVGVLVGAVIVAVATELAWAASSIFLVCTVVLAAAALVTWLTTHDVASSIRSGEAPVPARGSRDHTARSQLTGVAFAGFLVVVFVSSLGSNGLVSQLANVMPAVYGFTDTGTALLVGLAGSLNIATLLIAGRVLARTTSLEVFTAGTLVRGLGAMAMALVGLFTTPVLVLAALTMLITYQGIPIPRLAAPDLAARLAHGSPTRANGAYFAASAIGSTVGCAAAGIAAVHSYQGVLWIAGAAGIVASAIAIAWLRPAAAPSLVSS